MDRKKIRCDLCGFEFNTNSKIEEHYHDYELVEEEVFYPIKTRGRSPILFRNYICSTCMQNLDEVIRKGLIKNAEDYLQKTEVRFETLRKRYEEEVEKQKERDEHIKVSLEILKEKSSLLDFSEDLLNDIERNRGVFQTYYLRDSVKYLKEHKKYTILELNKKYGISFLKIDGHYTLNSEVTLVEYRNILRNSEVKGVSFVKLQCILEELDKEISSKMIRRF